LSELDIIKVININFASFGVIFRQKSNGRRKKEKLTNQTPAALRETDALISAPEIQSISDTLWDDLEEDLYIITLSNKVFDHILG
jgi:hypothetical protein